MLPHTSYLNQTHAQTIPSDTGFDFASSERNEFYLQQYNPLTDSGLADYSPKSPTQIPTEPTTPPSRIHIPRPPNAFMIYRSELVKGRVIPVNVEHRQQHLSRVAGQCWNLLSFEEKEKYHALARERLQEHKRDHPHYKFTPAPRGSRRSKAKASQQAQSEDKIAMDTNTRTIRERYTAILGPSLTASRRKKRGSKSKSVGVREMSPLGADLPPPLTFSGPSSPGSPRSPQSGCEDHLPSHQTSPLHPAPLFATNNSSQGTPHPFKPIFPGYPLSSTAFHKMGQSPQLSLVNVSSAEINEEFGMGMPTFQFEDFSFTGPPPLNLENLMHHNAQIVTPFAQPVHGNFALDLESSYRQDTQFCDGGPFFEQSLASTLQATAPAELVLPLNRFDINRWSIVNNPSEDFNYAMNHLQISDS
ncbi:hypothetical protein FA15DRAFT_700691 [Coprinopsis marcescibilis]|uniref:HMG box domain-containing protein n=1 Tax=Coprinopsis marcescibilis TaxID=230819 RepID=A0A5C3L7X9_COPMA|nr:hypothetical protein FA15DRAFT_700691 [Coprinopsis marcescibilis]